MELMVERLWPGATPEAVREVTDQLQSSCQQLAADGIPVRYLGATYIPSDESLSCRFDGTAQAVRAAHQLAGVPFDRLLVIHELSADLGTPSMGRDQNDIVARVVHHGAGVRLSPKASVRQIRDAVAEVLEHDRFGTSARRLASATADERKSADIVGGLEAMATSSNSHTPSTQEQQP